MIFSKELKKGRLLKRYKRFFADIDFNGEVLTAHLPNTGSLKEVPLTDTHCLFSTSDDPKRKLKYTLEFIQTPTGWAGVNTRTPNLIVKEALEGGLKAPYKNFQAEVKISEKSRIDFVLWTQTPPFIEKLKFPDYLEDPSLELHFIEVKNVTLTRGATALFPDSVTTRGTKHLKELTALAKKGFSTEILFVVQRENVTNFQPAVEIDPDYAQSLKEALQAGVKISAHTAAMDTKKVCLNWTDSLKIETC